MKHYQTNNVGFWKGFFSVYKYKFFQLSKIWKITKPNINKYFEIPRVQIQIGGRNIKPWLIAKYSSETKKIMSSMAIWATCLMCYNNLSNLWDSKKVESGCIPALTNKNTHIYFPFHCTGTLSSTYIMYIFRNNLFGFFPKQIPNPNISKYFWNDYLWNQIIPNFLKVSIEQIQIIPNTPLTPQIHPNTNFLWLFGAPNVMPWCKL